MKDNKDKKQSKYILENGEKPENSKYIKQPIEPDSDALLDSPPEPPKKSRFSSKIIKPPKTHEFKQEGEKDDGLIRKEVSGGLASSYFLDSVAESKYFLKQNRRFSAIYISILSLFLAAALTMLLVLNFFYRKHQRHLDQRTAIYNELRGQLDQLNLEYLSDVLLNPSIYHALDTQRRFEQYLFNYSISVSYGGKKYDYTTFKNNFNPQIFVSGGNDLIINFTETYTNIAQKYLSPDALKMFSLFVSPVKDQNGEWTMRDYRSFLDINDVQFFVNTVKDPITNTEQIVHNFNMSVQSVMTSTGNGYEIILHDFLGKKSGLAHGISFSPNNDSSRAAVRSLTDALDSVFGPISGEPFLIPLASGTTDELSLLYTYLNSLGAKIPEGYLSDYMRGDELTLRGVRNIIQSVIGADGILNKFTAKSKFYIDSALDNALSAMGGDAADGFKQAIKALLELQDKDTAQIQELASKTREQLIIDCKNEITGANGAWSKGFDAVADIMSRLNLVSHNFSASEVTQLNTLYDKFIEKAENTGTMTGNEEINFQGYLANILLYEYENKLARAQAIDLIERCLGLDLNFSGNAVLQDLAQYYNGGALTDTQKTVLNNILTTFSDDNIAKISLNYYTLNSLFKSFNFEDKFSLMGNITLTKTGGL